jgi:hypothetical protein
VKVIVPDTPSGSTPVTLELRIETLHWGITWT